MFVGNLKGKTVAEIIDASGDLKINSSELLEYLVANNKKQNEISYTVSRSHESDGNSGGLGPRVSTSYGLDNFYDLEKRSGLKNIVRNFDSIKAPEEKTTQIGNCGSFAGVSTCEYQFNIEYIAKFVLNGKSWLDLNNKNDRARLAQFMSVPKLSSK
ncbi:MAG: hypothetical protein V4691_04500 [Pseudomonadota bacterium]